MAGLFSMLSLLMFIGFIVGMINPKRVIFWGNEEKKTRSMVLKVYFGLFFVCSIMFGLSTEPSKQSEKATVDTKVEQKEEAKPVVEEEKPAVNPYLQYKDYPTHSAEYTFYYINEYVGGYYNSERAKVENVIANHPDKKLVKLIGDVLSLTRQDTGFYYSGELKNDRPHGIGAYYKKGRKNGSDYFFVIYQGEFKDGKANGYGQKYRFQNDMENSICLEFEGDFKDNNVNGNAIKYEFLTERALEVIRAINKDYVNSDITLSVGNFTNGDSEGILGRANGYANGKFKIYRNKHLSYDGMMKDDKFNGYGVEYYPNGNIRYKGEWKNGKFNGKGVLYKEDGSIEYDGQWKNDDYAN